MIVTQMDSRNVVAAMDLVQAKLLIALLRHVTLEQKIRASNEVQRDGFATLAPDAETARSSFVTVLGQYLDPVIHFSKTGKDGETGSESSGNETPPSPVN